MFAGEKRIEIPKALHFARKPSICVHSNPVWQKNIQRLHTFSVASSPTSTVCAFAKAWQLYE